MNVIFPVTLTFDDGLQIANVSAKVNDVPCFVNAVYKRANPVRT